MASNFAAFNATAVLTDMQRRLETLIEEHEPLDWTGSTELDAGEMRRLESLGYVVGSSQGDPFDSQLPDPKERIGDLMLFRDAASLFDRWAELQLRKVSRLSLELLTGN